MLRRIMTSRRSFLQLSGTIYIWEAVSGKLLTKFVASPGCDAG
jgi:hypothetical protein